MTRIPAWLLRPVDDEMAMGFLLILLLLLVVCGSDD